MNTIGRNIIKYPIANNDKYFISYEKKDEVKKRRVQKFNRSKTKNQNAGST
jgi:hypothetical protein